jgi:spore coat polysaccharide biosynthesis protein SpsF (cytidylyltransferase family)
MVVSLIEKQQKSFNMAVIIIQARLTSTRFPNKILEEIGDKPGLFHVLDQCLDSDARQVGLAIPHSQTEKFKSIINDYDKKYHKKLYLHSGSEDNVLKRFCEATSCFDSEEVIVRITSDCFLINKHHINKSINYFNENSFDYINNSTVTRVLSVNQPDDYQSDTSTPDGFNVEVFKKSTLTEAAKSTTIKYDIEHVTPWIKRNKICEVFDTGKISLKGKFSIDNPEDLDIIKALHILVTNDRINFE